MKARSERLSARKWVDSENRAGKASRYIRPFRIRPGDRVLLVLRVSKVENREHLEDQETNLRRRVKSKGGTMVGIRRYVGSGFDPCWVGRAVKKARYLGATILLAETTDRLIRHREYHSVKNPDAQATEEQLQELAGYAGGMILMTHLHPEASPREVRGYQSKRGQREKGRKGGRPKKRRYGPRYDTWPKALRSELKHLRANEVPFRDMEAETGIPKSTIQRYLSQFRAQRSCPNIGRGEGVPISAITRCVTCV